MAKPDNDKEYGAGKIKELYEAGLKGLRSHYLSYWIHHAFLEGDQWLYANEATNSVEMSQRDEDRVQVTVDKMGPNSRTIISKLVSRPLAFDVPPEAADDASIRAAHLSESVLRSLSIDQDWEGVREDASWGAWKGGTGFLAYDWDPQAGTHLGETETGQPYGTGDVKVYSLSWPDIVPQPGVRDYERGNWWIRQQALAPEVVQETYNLPEKPKADASAAMTPYQSKLYASHASMGTDAQVDLTKVLTYYERPSRKNPAGKMCVLVGDKIVAEGKWPFGHADRLNLVVIRETRVDGKPYGQTILRAARDVQTAINQSWSSIIEHIKLAGNARLATPQSAVDLVDSLTDEAGEVLPYPDGTEKPSWISPPEMPQWWIQEPAALKAEMDDIMGIHDVTRGDAPVNIESGLGLSILVEQDATPIGRLSKETSIAWGKLASLILKTIEKNATEPRKAIIRHGRGAAPETVKWTGKDLMGQTTAVVPLDAIMPRSKAQQMEMGKTLVEMGMISSLQEFLRVTEVAGSEDIMEALNPDIAKAQRENHQMATGQVVIPAVFDDHKIHNPEHLKFMKSAAWDSLTTEAQQIFLDHLQAHSTLDAGQAANMVSKAEMNPILATTAQTDSSPVLPVEALGTVAPPAPPLPPEGVAEAGLEAAIAEQHPGIDPALIESEI